MLVKIEFINCKVDVWRIHVLRYLMAGDCFVGVQPCPCGGGSTLSRVFDHVFSEALGSCICLKFNSLKMHGYADRDRCLFERPTRVFEFFSRVVKWGISTALFGSDGCDPVARRDNTTVFQELLDTPETSA